MNGICCGFPEVFLVPWNTTMKAEVVGGAAVIMSAINAPF